MLFWFVIGPVLIAVFMNIVPFKKAGKFIAIIAQTVLTGFSFYLFMLCKETEIVTWVGNYREGMGIMLKADILSSVFVMLTCFIFLISALYSFNERTGKLLLFLFFIWEGLLIGIFLSCDLFNNFVLLEVATVIVSILIMFKRDSRSMHDGMVYLMANTVAIQFYLFGIGYIYKLTGVLNMDSAALALRSIDKSSQVLPFALIMTSISLKCALMPLFSWLPRAHSTHGAPTVVSGILSGLHIKSGIYLFIRFQHIFQDLAVNDFFLITGIITGIAGFIFALSQTDIKLILAYHTISQIGMIMIGLNSGSVYTYTGGIYHIINHALFKTALFLCAGIIVNVYGTRNIYKIKGVFRRIPMVGTATILAMFGITGAPFFNGSISKYFIMSGATWLVYGIILLINLGTIVSFIKFSTMLFGKCDSEITLTKVTVPQQAVVLLLGTMCLTGGIFGEQCIEFLFTTKVSVDAIGYLQKIGLYLISVIAGYFIFKYYVKKSRLFVRIHEIELSFRGICVSIGAFFALILMVVKLHTF